MIPPEEIKLLHPGQILVYALIPADGSGYPRIVSLGLEGLEREALEYFNKARGKNGKPPLSNFEDIIGLYKIDIVMMQLHKYDPEAHNTGALEEYKRGINNGIVYLLNYLLDAISDPYGRISFTEILDQMLVFAELAWDESPENVTNEWKNLHPIPGFSKKERHARNSKAWEAGKVRRRREEKINKKRKETQARLGETPIDEIKHAREMKENRRGLRNEENNGKNSRTALDEYLDRLRNARRGRNK